MADLTPDAFMGSLGNSGPPLTPDAYMRSLLPASQQLPNPHQAAQDATLQARILAEAMTRPPAAAPAAPPPPAGLASGDPDLAATEYRAENQPFTAADMGNLNPNPYEGQLITELPFVAGPMQIGKGAKNLVTGGGEGRLRGASDIVRGGMEAATPAIPGALAKAPLATVAGLGAGIGAQQISEPLLRKLGLSPGGAALSSDAIALLTGALAGGGAHKIGRAVDHYAGIGERVMEAPANPDAFMSGLGKANAADARVEKIAAKRARTKPEPPRTGEPEQVSRVTDARERLAQKLTGKPWAEVTNSEGNAIDELITKGYGMAVEQTQEKPNATQLQHPVDREQPQGQTPGAQAGKQQQARPGAPAPELVRPPNQPAAPQEAVRPPTTASGSPVEPPEKIAARKVENLPAQNTYERPPREPTTKPAYGREVAVAVPGEDKVYRARYAVREGDDVYPSHNPFNFEENPDYEHRNDRDYKNNQQLSSLVAERSTPEKYNPDYTTTESPTAEHGAPVWDANGNVLGGNSRTMTQKRVYEANPQGAATYRGRVLDPERAAQFGINPGELSRFKKPMLGRELLENVDPQDAITDFNKRGAAEHSPAEQAVADGRRLSREAVQMIAGKLGEVGEDSTLAQAISGDNGAEIVNRLVKDGVITPQERNGLVEDRGDHSVLTVEGKDRIAKMLVGRLFETPAQFNNAPPELRGKLERVAPQVLRLEGRPEWDVTPQLREGLAVLEDARAHGLKNFEDLVNQPDMEGKVRSYSPEALAVAKVLRNGPNAAAGAFRRFANDEALSRPGAPATMFEPPTRAESFRDAFMGEKHPVVAGEGERGSFSRKPKRRDERQASLFDNPFAEELPPAIAEPKPEPETTRPLPPAAAAPDNSQAIRSLEAARDKTFGETQRRYQEQIDKLKARQPQPAPATATPPNPNVRAELPEFSFTGMTGMQRDHKGNASMSGTAHDFEGNPVADVSWRRENGKDTYGVKLDEYHQGKPYSAKLEEYLRWLAQRVADEKPVDYYGVRKMEHNWREKHASESKLGNRQNVPMDARSGHAATAAEARDAYLRMAKIREELERGPEPQKPAAKPSPEDRIAAALKQAQPGEGLVTAMGKVRAALPDLSKEQFDRAAENLLRDRRVWLHDHTAPHTLGPTDQAELVKLTRPNGEDRYYGGMASRTPEGETSRLPYDPARPEGILKQQDILREIQDPNLKRAQREAGEDAGRLAHQIDDAIAHGAPSGVIKGLRETLRNHLSEYFPDKFSKDAPAEAPPADPFQAMRDVAVAHNDKLAKERAELQLRQPLSREEQLRRLRRGDANRTPSMFEEDNGGQQGGLFGSEKGGVNANLLSLGGAKFVEEDVAPRVKETAANIAEAADDVLKLVAPAMRGGPLTEQAALIMRNRMAELARRSDQAADSVRAASRMFARQPYADNLDFMQRMESGQKQKTPELDAIAKVLRQMLDGRRRDVQALGTGKLQSWIDNYFPHMWKDPKRAADVFASIFGRRPLEGSKSFLKQRSVPTIADGLARGLEPVTDNPVDMAILKMREMDRYIMAHRVLSDWKEAKLLKYVDAREGKAPAGWRQIADPIGTIYGPSIQQISEHPNEGLWNGLQSVANALGLKQERGFLNLGNAVGRATRAGEVKTLHGTAEDVLAHEIGHQIDFRAGSGRQFVLEYPDAQTVARLKAARATIADTKGTTPDQRKAARLELKDLAGAIADRKEFAKQLRDLADLRSQGGGHSQAYVRSREEKMAQLAEMWVGSRELFKRTAPKVYDKWAQFLDQNPKLHGLRDIEGNTEVTPLSQPYDVGGLVTKGHYYAPEGAARILNNYLSPGLRQQSGAFRVALGANNFLNQMQLGLSAFHLGFTSADATVSRAALGYKALFHGHPIAAAKAFAETPVAAFTTALKGDKLLREWYKPGSQGGDIGKIVDGLVSGGGRAHMDEFYQTHVGEQMLAALRKGNVWGAAIRAPFAGTEALTNVIMREIVPRQKLGVFSDLARFEMERLGPNATFEQTRAAMTKAWDSVENRMGQMTYDNLFWHRYAKDLAMLSTRSVGWNLGTLREVGGGLGDIVKQPINALQGKPVNLNRLSYLAGLVTVHATMAALYQYLKTGKGPDQLEDYFFPRNGETDEQGRPQRISLPTYVKDVYHYATEPKRTIANKVSPLLNAFGEMIHNRDFYGTEIRHADDPLVSQLRDLAEYAGKQAIPFGIRNERREAKLGASPETRAEQFVGITPAPSGLNSTPAERMARELAAERSAGDTRTKDQAARRDLKRELTRSLAMKRGIPDQVRQAFRDGRLTKADVGASERSARMTPLQRSFNGLQLEQALKVYGAADAGERKSLRPMLARKAEALKDQPPEARARMTEMLRAALSKR